MGSLARNTYYNISAFVINTILALATVSVLVRGYGVEGYGIIILARLMLPTGVMGLLEAGFPEVTSRAVAAARALNDTNQIGRRISAASLMAMGIGLVAAIALISLDDVIARLVFHSADVSPPVLQNVIYVSALSLPLQLVGSVLRGAFEGDGRFGLVRTVEVLSNLGFLLAAVLFRPSTSVGAALTYVWIWNARSMLYFLIVLFGGRERLSFRTDHIWRDNAAFLKHAVQLSSGKFFSALLTFGPSAFLGAYANAGVVGNYEIVMRVPRVLKTVSGMFNGALLPFAARSDTLGEHLSTNRVVERGTMIVVALVVMLSFTGFLFSQELLRYWLGIADPELSLYLRIALLWPILASTIGIGSTMLLSRPSAATSINKLSMATTVGYFVCSLALYPWLEWRAFIIGLVASQCFTIPAYWRLQAEEYDVDLRLWIRFLWKLFLVACSVLSLSLAMRYAAPIDSLAVLLAHMCAVAIASSVGIFFFAASPDMRYACQKALKESLKL